LENLLPKLELGLISIFNLWITLYIYSCFLQVIHKLTICPSQAHMVRPFLKLRSGRKMISRFAASERAKEAWE
jgi:hypothetical protein